MIQVSQLYIYPVKSLGGIALPAVNIARHGFEHDRRWMITDEHGHFLSQREIPAMAMLHLSAAENGWKLQHVHDSNKNFFIPLAPPPQQPVTVQIWGSKTAALPAGEAADEWFTQQLGMQCKLVYMPEQEGVLVDEQYNINHGVTAFSDGFPILMTSEASLELFNSRSTEIIPMNRFRPNMVISGTAAHEEDSMKEFSINGIHFFGVKPSARCVVTTINQTTAAKGKEPLKTLSIYRSQNNKTYFGENVMAAGTGTISTGNIVTILSKKDGLFGAGIAENGAKK